MTQNMYPSRTMSPSAVMNTLVSVPFENIVKECAPSTVEVTPHSTWRTPEDKPGDSFIATMTIDGTYTAFTAMVFDGDVRMTVVTQGETPVDLPQNEVRCACSTPIDLKRFISTNLLYVSARTRAVPVLLLGDSHIGIGATPTMDMLDIPLDRPER